MIKCDIQDSEGQNIVRYLAGLNLMYSNLVELQQYSTLNKVCVLAHKGKKQRKLKSFQHEFPQSLPYEQPSNSESSSLLPNPMATPSPTPLRFQAP